jgi:microcystin-dependent protein
MDTNLVESPLANVLGTLPGSSKEKLFRGDTEHSAALGDSAVGKVGSSRPHSNLMPSLSVNYIIAYDGDYPTLD